MRLAIVCLTCERPNALARFFSYWANIVQESELFSVIIVDGSRVSANLYCSGSRSIRYFHQRCSYHERLQFALSCVCTDYTLLTPDDEFFVPSALGKMVDFLDRHRDFSSVHGLTSSFERLNNVVRFSWAYRSVLSKKLEADNPIVRLKSHFGNYTPSHVYSVCRTSTLRSAFSVSTTNPLISQYGSCEYFIEAYIVLSGKSKFFPHLYWLRSLEKQTPPMRGTGEVYLDMNNQSFKSYWRDNIHGRSIHNSDQKRLVYIYFLKFFSSVSSDELFDAFSLLSSSDRPLGSQTALKICSDILRGVDGKLPLPLFGYLLRKLNVVRKYLTTPVHNRIYFKGLCRRSITVDRLQLSTICDVICACSL